MANPRGSVKVKFTFSLDVAVAKKIKRLAVKMSSETAYFGGRKNNQTAVIIQAVDALWDRRHPPAY